MKQFFTPVPPSPTFATHSLLFALFALNAIRSAVGLAKSVLKAPPARAMLAGLAAHSIQPLQNPTTGGYGLMLGVSGHLYGWPVVRGGSPKIAGGLGGPLQRLRGSVGTRR